MKVLFRGIETSVARAFQRGERDAHGQRPLVQTGAGLGPCRHCLEILTEDQEKVILAFMPFATPQPYAEIGPIFLHPGECSRYEAPEPPGWFEHLEPAVLRGYDERDWIRYDTGAVVEGCDVSATAHSILEDPHVAYVHVRSRFGCLQCRVDRG